MIYLIVIIFQCFYIGFRGNTMLTTLYAISLEASTFQVGIIVGLASLFPMLLSIYIGQVSDRIGFSYPLMFGSFGVSIALFLPYIVKGELYILFISQAIFGLAFILLLVNIQNLVGKISSIENRSQNYAIYSLGLSTASLLGPLITGFSIDHFGYNNTYLILSLMAAVPGFIILSKFLILPPMIADKDKSSNSFRDLLVSRSLRKTFILSGMILAGIGIYEFYFPIYGKHIGLSASMIGVILSVNASAFIIVRLFMPLLIKRFTEEGVFRGCLFIAAGAFVLIPFFKGFIALAIVSFLLGIGLGCGQPLSIVMAYNASPKGRTGEVLGIRLTVNKIVQFFVPILFGSVGAIVGFFPVFWSNALLLFTGGIFSFLDKKNSNERKER